VTDKLTRDVLFYSTLVSILGVILVLVLLIVSPPINLVALIATFIVLAFAIFWSLIFLIPETEKNTDPSERRAAPKRPALCA
jgi:hypothetical protein